MLTFYLDIICSLRVAIDRAHALSVQDPHEIFDCNHSVLEAHRVAPVRQSGASDEVDAELEGCFRVSANAEHPQVEIDRIESTLEVRRVKRVMIELKS